MSTRDELLFLESARYGVLYYHNVYSYYDEPIIFTALNEYDQLFFCYSLGNNETHDRWIIVPTSQDKVNKLEQKDLSITGMIKQVGKIKILLLEIDLNDFSIKESLINSKKFNFKMPNENVFIHENINYDGRRKHTHRIRIAKTSSSEIMSEVLNKVSEVFGEFCRHYLRKHDISVSLFPQDAVEGSFVYRVKTKAKDDHLFKTKGYELLSKVSINDSFTNALKQQEIDLRIVRKLFDLIGTNNIEIQLIDEDTTDTVLNLSPSYVREIIPEVDNLLGAYLDSSMVPQADNLSRIKKYLSLLADKHLVTAEELDVDPRQVDYYRDACKILSLIHDYSSLTPLGLKVAQSQSNHEWINIIQRQFEESDCGSLWMLNQKVDSLLEIDEGSAVQFLIENCNGLSISTSTRRAQTLKSWVKAFKQYS
ncbi:DUF6575 domain-containing protein [Rheinheimera sp. NSM]|uniref:DUF6575 domain-containing protein n=1 Tax=Rheinheimera sp. NSM TaxID=3457884 RepID=UPI00403610BA